MRADSWRYMESRVEKKRRGSQETTYDWRNHCNLMDKCVSVKSTGPDGSWRYNNRRMLQSHVKTTSFVCMCRRFKHGTRRFGTTTRGSSSIMLCYYFRPSVTFEESGHTVRPIGTILVSSESPNILVSESVSWSVLAQTPPHVENESQQRCRLDYR